MAGGSGTRAATGLGGVPVNKVYLPMAGRPVLAWSVRDADRAAGVTRIVLVVRQQDRELAERLLREYPPTRPVDVVTGGASRHESESAGLKALTEAVEDGQIDVIAIHDGARPLAGRDLFARVIRAADQHGGAIPGMPAPDVVPRDRRATPSKGQIMRVQTPQAFRAPELIRAYAQADDQGFTGTDTASTVERFSDLAVQVIPGVSTNIKVTYPGDLERAQDLASKVR